MADPDKSAVVSDCGHHRYSLWRKIADKGPRYTFIGVNPSTANGQAEDATTRKWRGFMERWGGSEYRAVNLFSAIATDVKELRDLEPCELRGHLWHDYVADAINWCDIIVPCWGSRSKLHKSLHGLVDDFQEEYLSLEYAMCFGKVASGDPKHPLMLGYDTKLVPM